MKRYIVSVLFILSFYGVSFSQPEQDPMDDAIPVDGGIGILLAAGAAWGIKKLKEKK